MANTPLWSPGTRSGDMAYNNDFRGLYGTLLDRWMGIDPYPILDGAFQQFDMIKQ